MIRKRRVVYVMSVESSMLWWLPESIALGRPVPAQTAGGAQKCGFAQGGGLVAWGFRFRSSA
jgi:hypothetical protein